MIGRYQEPTAPERAGVGRSNPRDKRHLAGPREIPRPRYRPRAAFRSREKVQMCLKINGRGERIRTSDPLVPNRFQVKNAPRQKCSGVEEVCFLGSSEPPVWILLTTRTAATAEFIKMSAAGKSQVDNDQECRANRAGMNFAAFSKNEMMLSVKGFSQAFSNVGA